jgi:hypothetical protein
MVPEELGVRPPLQGGVPLQNLNRPVKWVELQDYGVRSAATEEVA